MDTAFSSGRSTPLNWDDCEDNATCDEVAEFLDEDEELEALQVSFIFSVLNVFTLNSLHTFNLLTIRHLAF